MGTVIGPTDVRVYVLPGVHSVGLPCRTGTVTQWHRDEVCRAGEPDPYRGVTVAHDDGSSYNWAVQECRPASWAESVLGRLRGAWLRHGHRLRVEVLMLRMRWRSWRGEKANNTWVCPTCGFRLHKMTINMGLGVVHADERLSRELCPNDGALLVQE